MHVNKDNFGYPQHIYALINLLKNEKSKKKRSGDSDRFAQQRREEENIKILENIKTKIFQTFNRIYYTLTTFEHHFALIQVGNQRVGSMNSKQRGNRRSLANTPGKLKFL